MYLARQKYTSSLQAMTSSIISFIANQFGKRISLNKNAQYENCLTVKHENLLNTTSLPTTVSFFAKINFDYSNHAPRQVRLPF